MNKEEYDKLSTFDKIEYDIDMQMYMEHNDKIASIYDHLGEVYGYQDLEDAKALEQHDTFELYKKALKEKCDAIDKAIEYINNFNVFERFSFPLMKRWEEEQVKGSIDYEFNDTLKKELLNILQGDDKE